jgi:hypothetical protein
MQAGSGRSHFRQRERGFTIAAKLVSQQSKQSLVLIDLQKASIAESKPGWNKIECHKQDRSDVGVHKF